MHFQIVCTVLFWAASFLNSPASTCTPGFDLCVAPAALNLIVGCILGSFLYYRLWLAFMCWWPPNILDMRVIKDSSPVC